MTVALEGRVPIELCRGIPFPAANAIGYRELFALEQWLRRLTHLALNAAVGPSIAGAIPPELNAEVKKRRAQIASTAYLGVAVTADDLVWLTTLDELRSILLLDHIYPAVRRLTGLPSALIAAKLDEVREIRNAVGHNRVLSQKTCRILEAAVLSLEDAFVRLREHTLGGPECRLAAPNTNDDVIVAKLQVALAERSDLLVPTERITLTADDFFYYASLLPRHFFGPDQAGVAELGEWIDAQRLVNAIWEVRKTVIAVLMPVRGTSFELLWSKKASNAEHQQILSVFVRSVDAVWGDTEIGSQDEQFFADSLLWLLA